MAKIVFTMNNPDPKKHSTRFDLDRIETPQETWMEKFKPSFYIPRPFAETAKRIRVTLEVIE